MSPHQWNDCVLANQTTHEPIRSDTDTRIIGLTVNKIAIGLYRENAIAIESEAIDPNGIKCTSQCKLR